MRALKGEIARQKRTERPFSLVLIDIDHFKQVNDEHGHQAGDRVLVHVAAHLKASARPYDTVARVGGEEVGLLLPDADVEVGSLVADRMRASLEQAGVRGDLSPAVTISAGVAELETTRHDHLEDGAGHNAQLAAPRHGVGEGPARDGDPHPALDDGGSQTRPFH